MRLSTGRIHLTEFIEPLGKGEVKWETGTDVDEDYAEVTLSVSIICAEISAIWK